MVYDYKDDESGQEEVLALLHTLIQDFEGEYEYKYDGINGTTITLEHDSNTKLELSITINQDFLRDCITDALNLYVKKKG